MTRFRHLLTQTCAVSRRTGVDSFGDPSFGAIENLACAHSSGRTIVRDADGIERVSTDTLVMEGRGPNGAEAPITETDRIWIPGQPTTGTPRTPVSVRGEPSRVGGFYLWQINL